MNVFARLLILSCASLAAPVGAAADIGRLFFTPAMRQDLDIRRAAGGEDPGPTAILSEPVPRAPQEVVVNGLIVRGNTSPQVWLNGTPVTDQTDFQVQGSADRQQRVRVQSRADGISARLKPGQAWAPKTGRIRECFDCDEVPATASPTVPAMNPPVPPATPALPPAAEIP